MGGAVAPLIINKASADPRYREHPGLKLYGIESYIAVPLNRRDGTYFGTLCALDPLPARLSEDDLSVFQLLGNLIAFELEADERQRLSDEQLREAERTGKLREQLMGILGHDLRNPLNTISMAAEVLLMGGGFQEKQIGVVQKIASSADRMKRMIEDLLDFTRGRLGEGIPVMRQTVSMQFICRQTIEEFELAHPNRIINFHAEGEGRGNWDPDRAAQVVSNLVGNALQYSLPETPVRVHLHDEGSATILSVNNQGPPIPPDIIGEIFNPFRRGGSSVENGIPSSGLGLGLYIVQQVMLAHGGSIDVRSNEEEGTTFTTRWPCRLSAAAKT